MKFTSSSENNGHSHDTDEVLNDGQVADRSMVHNVPIRVLTCPILIPYDEEKIENYIKILKVVHLLG